jgi:hypothetical protein
VTFVRANSLGWGLFELLTSTQMNTIDSQMPYALDGRDGGSYAQAAGITLVGTASASAFVLALVGKSASEVMNITAVGTGGVGIDFISSGDVKHISTTANSLNQAGKPVTPYNFLGHANSGGGGGDGAKSTGGASTLVPGLGGNGFEAVGGTSDFTGGATTLWTLNGSSGIRSIGGSITGVHANQLSGFGIQAIGGGVSGTGKGGVGVYASGGAGGSGVTANADFGIGLLGVGAPGVHGLNGSVNSFTMAEFESFNDNRAAVRASSKTYGRSMLAEHSGVTDLTELNLFTHVGDPHASTGKAIVHILQDVNGVGSSEVGLTIGMSAIGGMSPFNAIAASSYKQTTATFAAFNDGTAGQYYPAIRLDKHTNQAPDVQVNGGLAYVDKDDSTIIGSACDIDCFFMGLGDGRYDRIVGSSDPGALQAWARVVTDGIGGVTLGYNYGVASVSFSGTDVLVTLNTHASGDPLVIIPTASSPYGGILCNPDIVNNRVQCTLMDFATGTALDLTTFATEFYIMMCARTAWGITADQPTYYRP